MKTTDDVLGSRPGDYEDVVEEVERLETEIIRLIGSPRPTAARVALLTEKIEDLKEWMAEQDASYGKPAPMGTNTGSRARAQRSAWYDQETAQAWGRAAKQAAARRKKSALLVRERDIEHRGKLMAMGYSDEAVGGAYRIFEMPPKKPEGRRK